MLKYSLRDLIDNMGFDLPSFKENFTHTVDDICYDQCSETDSEGIMSFSECSEICQNEADDLPPWIVVDASIALAKDMGISLEFIDENNPREGVFLEQEESDWQFACNFVFKVEKCLGEKRSYKEWLHDWDDDVKTCAGNNVDIFSRGKQCLPTDPNEKIDRVSDEYFDDLAPWVTEAIERSTYL